MATEWREECLSTLCAYLNRGAAPVYTHDGGILVLNQKCIRDQRVSFEEARRTDTAEKQVVEERMLRPFDILVNSTGVGTLGRVAQIRDLPEPTTVDSHVTVVRPDPRAVDPLYLGMALRCLESDVESLGEGSTGQTELSRSRLGSFTVPVPSRNEQHAIARILGALDDKRDLNRRMSATLEEMATALFKSWFVEFDPVRAKGRGVRTSLPPTLERLLPSGFELSQLGQIPRGWPVSTLGDHVTVAKGLSYKGEHLADSGLPLHNLNSVYEGGGYKYEGIKYYTGEYTPRHMAEPGDILVANTEQGHDRLLVGYAAVIPEDRDFRGLYTHHLYRVRLKSESPLTALFVCRLLNSRRMQQAVSGFANGTTVNMLPIEALQLPAFALPPIELVNAFHEIASLVLQRQAALRAESLALAAVARGLLPKLILGQVKLKPDAHRQGM